MTIAERLQKYIDEHYGSHKEFAEKVGITPYTLSRYINDKGIPVTDILLRFLDLGMSVDWLLTGIGEMTLYQKSKDEENDEEDEEVTLPRERVYEWIVENYGSLEHFATVINLNLNSVNNILKHNFILDPEFIALMRAAGCNIKWLSTGEGTKYAHNTAGMVLKLQKNGVKNIFDKTNDFRKFFDSKDLNNLSIKVLHELLNIALQEESNGEGTNNGKK